MKETKISSSKLYDSYFDVALDQVKEERHRAILKHGWDQTPASRDMHSHEKLAILVEEVGEVARATTYDESDEDNLYKELIQVATMALMWAESL